jgi:hypothetical protein
MLNLLNGIKLSLLDYQPTVPSVILHHDMRSWPVKKCERTLLFEVSGCRVHHSVKYRRFIRSSNDTLSAPLTTPGLLEMRPGVPVQHPALGLCHRTERTEDPDRARWHVLWLRVQAQHGERTIYTALQDVLFHALIH